jgi:hypothetical protein
VLHASVPRCGRPTCRDGSRLIRNHYVDNQLLQYIVKDRGGDSVAVLRILEKLFFDCDFPTRVITSISCPRLVNAKHVSKDAIELNGQGPGLVAKFRLPQNFYCDSKEGDERPGYARFTTWNKPATFVPPESPTDDA